MLGKASTTTFDLSTGYHEESIRIPAVITVVILLLIGIPMALWIYRIDKTGEKATNISKYETLVTSVDSDVQVVNAVLDNDATELEAINAARSAGTVRLIVPEVVIVEQRDNSSKVNSPLDIEMDGIYWSPANPLMTIGGETYREGDTIQGYIIVDIGKRSATFKGKDGSLIEKDIYENLLQNKR